MECWTVSGGEALTRPPAPPMSKVKHPAHSTIMQLTAEPEPFRGAFL